MANANRLMSVVRRLSDSRRYKVLVYARLLVLRQCVIEQYRIEKRSLPAVAEPKYIHAHWVR